MQVRRETLLLDGTTRLMQWIGIILIRLVLLMNTLGGHWLARRRAKR